MTDVKVSNRAAAVGRLGTAAAWIAAVGCLPYLFLKAVWTFDMPVGVSEQREPPAQHDNELGGAHSSQPQIADGFGDSPLQRYAEDAALAEALRAP